jgi:hypothetical protein
MLTLILGHEELFSWQNSRMLAHHQGQDDTLANRLQLQTLPQILQGIVQCEQTLNQTPHPPSDQKTT